MSGSHGSFISGKDIMAQRRNKKRSTKQIVWQILLLAVVVAVGWLQWNQQETAVSLEDVPDYTGTPYVAVNGNEPEFSQEEMTTEAFESYSPLDALGRCGTAYANVGQELMPTEERGNIGQVRPSGWQTVKYDIVDGKYLYNRCHLIGYQLTGENANKQNLILSLKRNRM